MVGIARLDDREAVEQHLERPGRGPSEHLTRRGHCFERDLVTPGLHGKGRDRLDGHLEGIGVVDLGACIEDEHDPSRRRGLVLAHHELPAARGGAPADTTGVVTRFVLPQREELGGGLVRGQPLAERVHVGLAAAAAVR